jgi:hypothetical protein
VARKPLSGAKVLAYDHDPLFLRDDLLGEALTDSDGSFRIEFDESKFAGVLAFLEGSPDVYLSVRDARDNVLLKTQVCKTLREIKYHVKISGEAADRAAVDVYAGNTRRMLAYLRDAGATMGLEQRVNLDMLRNPNLATDAQARLRASTAGFSDAQANFNHLMALLDGVVNRDLEERHLGTIGYDGPQVPPRPRREAHADAIEWPRSEAFRWG